MSDIDTRDSSAGDSAARVTWTRHTADVLRLWLSAAVPVVVVAILFGLLWHAVVWFFEIPAILLPTPGRVASAGWEHRRVLTDATLLTGRAALTGFLTSIALGVVISLVFSQSRHIRNAFFPYVIFLQTVPIVAIAPLLITWSGYTFQTVVYITVIISLFPIINNVTAGLVAVEPHLQELFQIYHAGRLATMIKLRIPTAVRYLVLGMRVSSGLAVIGAIIGDFFVGSGAEYDGLGTLMTRWGARQRTDAVISALFASALLGILFFGAVQLFSRLVLRRWTFR